MSTFPWGAGPQPPSIGIIFLGPDLFCSPNGILIGSTIFAQSTVLLLATRSLARSVQSGVFDPPVIVWAAGASLLG